MSAPYLHFEPAGASTTGKTKRWYVLSTHSSATLGIIQFRPTWRKYCFEPAWQTVFDPDCLRELATFLEQETAAWRNKEAT